MMGKILRLTPHRFSITPGKDAYELLVTRVDRIYNIGLFRTCGVDYTTFKLELAAQNW